MRGSGLHLEGYFLRELSVELNKSFADKTNFAAWNGYHYHPDKSFKVEPTQFQVKSEIGRKIDDPSRWRYELSIRSSGRKDKIPYSFRISIAGYFHIHADKILDGDERSIVYVNAPSVLFSAARDLLASATARGPFPAVILPLVSFADEAEDIAVKSAKSVQPLLLKGKPAKKGATKRSTRKATKK